MEGPSRETKSSPRSGHRKEGERQLRTNRADVARRCLKMRSENRGTEGKPIHLKTMTMSRGGARTVPWWGSQLGTDGKILHLHNVQILHLHNVRVVKKLNFITGFYVNLQMSFRFNPFFSLGQREV